MILWVQQAVLTTHGINPKLIDFVLLEALPYWMFSLLSVNVVYIALSAAKLVFFGHGIDNIVTLASAVHSHLARIRRQNRQRPQPCTWRLDKTRHCLPRISVFAVCLQSIRVGYKFWVNKGNFPPLTVILAKYTLHGLVCRQGDLWELQTNLELGEREFLDVA